MSLMLLFCDRRVADVQSGVEAHSLRHLSARGVQLLQKQCGSLSAHFVHGLLHGGELRLHHRCHRAFAEAYNRYILRDAYAGVFEGFHGSDCHRVVEAENGVGERGAGVEQTLCRVVAVLYEDASRQTAAFGVDAVALYNFSGMNGVYAGDIPAEVSNLYQAVAIVAAVIGIFAFYHAVLFVLSLIRRGGKWKNRGINSVLLGSLFQKISSTAKVLSISTLAVTVSLVAFVVLPTLAEITTGYLEYRMPYHVMIYNTYRYIDEMDDIPQIDFSFVGEILRRRGIEISEEVTQESYFVWERDFNTVDTREHWRDMPRLAMGISDYNRMREMAGFPLVPLGENEFFMHLDYEMDMEEMAGSIRTRTLELDDGTQLGLAETAVYNEPLGKYLFNSDGSILVFPDDVCGRLHLARTCYYANTQTAVPYGDCNVIRDEIDAAFRENYGYLFERYEEKYQSDRHYVSFIDPIRFWTQENNDVVLTAVSVRLLGIYAGTIFFIICMTVLALHLITDSIDFSAQYRTLHQIGVEREDLAGMVSRKSFCYFFVPCITAFIIALSVIYSFAVRYGHKILTYMGTSGFQFGVLIPGLLVATVLVCYYGITIYAIKRNLTVTLDLQARGYSR